MQPNSKSIIFSKYPVSIWVVLVSWLLINACTQETTSPQNVAVTSVAANADSTVTTKRLTIQLPGLAEDATKLKMVLIPSGTFKMGSATNEPGRNAKYEWPLHEVTIAKPFYLAQYEVTQAQWEAVMGKDSHHSKFKDRPNHPVEKVSWLDCQRFINKLNELGQGTFRLPTEAEWEYACRAGTQTPFSFGAIADSVYSESAFEEIANNYLWWRGNNNPPGTKAVGLKLPNPWGLYDMHGNVNEWCADKWKPPTQRGAYTDTSRPFSNWEFLLVLRNRVNRGGDFMSAARSCCSAARYYEQSIDYHYRIGFRIAREYP